MRENDISELRDISALRDMYRTQAGFEKKFAPSKLSVAFVVSDTRIGEAETLVKKYKSFFQEQVLEIICTSVEGIMMDEIVKNKITLTPPDKLGGAETVASKIVKGQVDVLILLIDDFEEYQPHAISIEALKRTASYFVTQVVTSEFNLKCLIDNFSYPNIKKELLSCKRKLQTCWNELVFVDRETQTDALQINAKALQIEAQEEKEDPVRDEGTDAEMNTAVVK